jgi:hypothetical protein
MDHPDKSMLFASTRQQPDGWSGEIERHIAQCPICYTYYTECQRINTTLVNWAHDPAYRTYPSITDSVVQKLIDVELSSNDFRRVVKGVKKWNAVEKWNERVSQPMWRLASPYVAVAAAILCTIVVFALATAYMHRPGNTSHYPNISKPTVVVSQHTPQPRLSPTAVSTATQNDTQNSSTQNNTQNSSSSGARSGGPSIIMCSSPTDVQQNRLRICGNNFKPGSHVSLVIEMQGSRPKVLKPVVVQADGSMQDWFFVHSCDTLPSAIAVQYANSAVVLATLENIQFAGCNR